MHRKWSSRLLSLLLVGWLSSGCGNDDPQPPTPPTNKPPTLTGPTAQASEVTSGATVTLSVTATDPDGDALTYAWSQTPASPAGTFSSPSVADPMWTAPQVASDTDFQLSVTVTDGQGGSVSASVTVTVLAPVNEAPVLSQSPEASPSAVTGSAPVTLTVIATDADGDPLTYAWTQEPASPAGTFSDSSVANPTWTAPVVGSATSFTLHVQVSDGRGGTVQGQVSVDVAPPVPENIPPTLATPTATPSTLDADQATSLSVTASDADGDPLTYTWVQEPASPAGTFSSTSVATPTWTAPRIATETTFQLRVTVSDGRGGTANDAAPVTVRAFVNSPPAITGGPSASPSTLDEQQTTNLSVSATDPDSDPLTYLWEQTDPASPVGTFSSTSVATPTWTAPDVTASGTFTLRATISDGQGGSVQGTVDVTVNKVNQSPTVDATISGPSTLAAGTTGAFSITASDPDGDPLTYSWTQTAPATQGTFVGSQTSSSAQWFSPVVGAETSFTLSVSVTDGQSTPIVRTLTLPVTVPPYSSVQNIWNTVPCTGCHGSSGGLSLAAGSSHTNLVNVNANNSNCNTLQRVSPGDPDNSVLIRKMEGTTCGTRMPANNQNYFSQNPGLLVRVRSWILAGAAND